MPDSSCARLWSLFGTKFDDTMNYVFARGTSASSKHASLKSPTPEDAKNVAACSGTLRKRRSTLKWVSVGSIKMTAACGGVCYYSAGEPRGS